MLFVICVIHTYDNAINMERIGVMNFPVLIIATFSGDPILY